MKWLASDLEPVDYADNAPKIRELRPAQRRKVVFDNPGGLDCIKYRIAPPAPEYWTAEQSP